MSISRTFKMVAKDLRLGPRSPIFLWAFFMPLVLTFLLQVVLLTLFDPKARLGIADLGESEVTAAVEKMDGIELTHAASAAELRKLVENNDVDAGLVLEKGFDAAVRTGARPNLEFYVSGESVASNRIVLAVTTMDLLRSIEGGVAPVDVVLEAPGGLDVPPISERLVPSLLLYVLIVGGMFVPAFTLVSERERRTLDALLVTPVKMSEILLSKAVLGFIMVMVMSYLTLAINWALAGEPLGLLVTLAVSSVICVELGLIYGTVAVNAKSLYTMVKSLNVFLVGPAVFYIFPSWPQWIAKLFPSYWFIDPFYQIALRGASLADVWTDLAIAIAIGAVLVVPIVFLGRRMQATLAAT
jgi:ABC-2 type transport system permease protein